MAGGPLEDLLVVAVEQAVAAPLCTVRLADAGARVIKIERAEGDPARHFDGAVQGTSAYFAWLNRGKESVVLDLKSEPDAALLRRLVGRADIFVQNLAPGAAARLGFAAADLVARHERLVALDIVGYGQDTDCRDMRAYDMLVQAESGICAVTGTPDEACKVGVSIADIGTGMTAHAALLEALLGRARSGRGQAIEIAMFDVMADWMSVPLLHWEQAGQATPRVGLAHAAIYPYGRFACRDGDVALAVQNAAEWRRLCTAVLGRPELVEDPRFADNPSRVRHREALAAAIAACLGGLTRAEAIARLDAAQIAWGRISSVADLSHHPALRRVEVGVPGGAFAGVVPPLQPGLAPGAVPALGEHTLKIRREFAA